MKLTYSSTEVERWRDKTYRRTEKLVVKNGRQALAFINSVGFCLASRSDGVELPNLWDAITSNTELPLKADRNYYLSYASELQNILPNHNSVYYGKVFKRRPSIVSREYFPYFYALSERSGLTDEYETEFSKGKLSAIAKKIMDVLMKNAPLTAKEIRIAAAEKGNTGSEGFAKALDELQRKMFLCRVVGNGHQLGTEWAPVVKCFPAEVRRARRISMDEARCKLLEKYFQNQLISSIESIHKVFAWSKQEIYHAIGNLMHSGIIMTTAPPDVKRRKCYCLIH